jgi:hypothetical protein
VIAQDTVWLNFPSDISQSTLGVAEYKGDLAILNVDYIPNTEYRQYSLYMADTDGSLLDSIKSIAIPSVHIISVNAFEQLEEALWFLATTSLSNGDTALLSSIIEPETKQITVIDTLLIDGESEFLFADDFISLANSSQLAGFGTIRSNQTNRYLSNFFIAISQTGKIEKFKIFDTINPYIILSFAEMDSTFFITYFDGTSAILDSGISIVIRQENLFKIQIEDTTFYPLWNFHGCRYSNGTLDCVGTLNSFIHGQFVIASINVLPDTIQITGFTSLLPPSPAENIVTGEFISDNNGDYIVTTTSFYNPFNQMVDSNKIFISKYSPEYGQLWHRWLSFDLEMAVSWIFIDQDNDIYISGFYWGSGEFKTRGFVLKIHSNGDIISFQDDLENEQEIFIYPNPVHEYLYVSTPCDQTSTYHIWNVSGIQVGKYSLPGCSGQIPVSHLTPGSYFISSGSNVTQFVKQ